MRSNRKCQFANARAFVYVKPVIVFVSVTVAVPSTGVSLSLVNLILSRKFPTVLFPDAVVPATKKNLVEYCSEPSGTLYTPW